MIGKDRQDRLTRILQEAFDLPHAQREAFVAEACGKDRELFAEIVALLSREEDASGSLDVGLDPGPDDATGSILKPAATGRQDRARATGAPQSVGPYKILETLGEGGMGVVYLAEQTEPVRRRVALKLIKLGMDTKDVVARFEAERQALAMMDHPNIARVYDAGATDDGRPYFVMEHIRGVRLDEYCDRHKLPLRRRLELFTQVCRGVEHAHRRGVIHRDLKPSNVLVSTPDQAPVAKIIDFGVARATNQRLTEKTLYTEIGRAVGTPAYMSPEQAGLSGEDVDHRTDVYSLGVMLYELLVGEPPLDPELLAKAAFDEILRRIREEDPPTPSTRWTRLNVERMTLLATRRDASPGELGGMFRGDLDWITMKAVEKERERRYRSASDLADDIVRHLEGDPVEAGPPSGLYRLGKYVRKNRIFVLAGSAVIAALTVGLVSSVLFALRAGRSESRFAEQAKIAGESEKKAGERLADFNRVSLIIDLEEMTAAADRLWPVTSRRAGELAKWLDDARELASRRDGLETTLDRLRERALPYSPSVPGKGDRTRLEAQESERRTWEFADAEDHWWQRTLVGFLEDLHQFVEVTIPDVERRLAFARSVREMTVEGAAVAAKWRQAIQRIGSSKRYGSDLVQRFTAEKLMAQEGLIPLGPDPSSGLEEFAHLLSGKPALRGEDGRLDFTDESGLVLVLLPGGRFLMGAEKEARLGLQVNEAGVGLVVENVERPSVAAVLGFESGDVLLEVNGKPVTAARELKAALMPYSFLKWSRTLGLPETTRRLHYEVEFRRGDERKTLSGKVEWNIDPQALEGEGPVHAVTLDAFFLSKYEMTQGQWTRFTGTNPSGYAAGLKFDYETINLRHPVEMVSWEEGKRELTRRGLRLPTEAQWEYAARAGTFTPWWTGGDTRQLPTAGNMAPYGPGSVEERSFQKIVRQLARAEWVSNDEHKFHAPVGSYRANAFGLHDVHGNVAEWCEDAFGVVSRGNPRWDPVSSPNSRIRVLRGGSWASIFGRCRSAVRDGQEPDSKSRLDGIRPARAVPSINAFPHQIMQK